MAAVQPQPGGAGSLPYSNMRGIRARVAVRLTVASLKCAHQLDKLDTDLWKMMQRLSQHRDSTTFMIATDHGRGSGLDACTDRGAAAYASLIHAVHSTCST